MRSTGASGVLAQPWIWSYLGALLVWIASIIFTRGYGAGGMITAGLALAVFSVITGVAQMFVITLGPGNVDLSSPATMTLSGVIAMKVMDTDSAYMLIGIVAAMGASLIVGIVNYVLIRLLRIPPIIATLSSSFLVLSTAISYGRGLRIKPPPPLADFATERVFGIPLAAIATFGLSLLIALVLKHTVYGRTVAAVGQNERAAWLAGRLRARSRRGR